MMNKKLITLTLLAAAIALPAAAAPTIQMINDSVPAYQFKVLQDGFAGYAAGTIMPTFCLEKHEYFNPGSSYYAVLNTSAVGGGNDWKGGVYGQTPLVAANGSDPLDQRTAYLYTKFMEGNSAFADQAKMQNAIHYIEAEIGTKNSYVTLAEQAINSGEWSGLGNVRVMNLWTKFDGRTYSGWAQDQLVLVAVPAPAALVLSGIGTLLVGLIRSRKLI